MGYNPLLEYVFYRPVWALSLTQFKVEVDFADRRRFRSVRQKIMRELRLRARERYLLNKSFDSNLADLKTCIRHALEKAIKLGWLTWPDPGVLSQSEVDECQY